MNTVLRPALVLFVALSLLTGIGYPLLVTGIAQSVFAHQANGSLIVKDGRTIGSALIGQSFGDPRHFWSRPSATAPTANNAQASGGSNQGPLNPALAEAVQARIAALRAADPGNASPVPVDLVTASASGLDPHISVAAASWQVPRIARVTGLPAVDVQALIGRHAETPRLGFMGEPRVDVLALNLALEGMVATR